MAKRPVVGSYVVLTKSGKLRIEENGDGEVLKNLSIAKLTRDDNSGCPFYIESCDGKNKLYWMHEGQIKPLKYKDCMKEEVLLKLIEKIGAKKVVKLLKQYRLTPKNAPDYMKGQDAHRWIDEALTWRDTPQGHDYWSNLYKKLHG